MGRKVCLYLRTAVSQPENIESQRLALNEYLAENGIRGDQIIEFSDDGESGLKRSRPGFDRMMDAVRGGEVGVVLIYSVSRLTRSFKDLVAVFRELEKAGVVYVSLLESKHGKKTRNLFAYVD